MDMRSNFQEVTAFIKRTQNSCGLSKSAIEAGLHDALANPENYGKIDIPTDQGLTGINIALRKHTNAETDFNDNYSRGKSEYEQCHKCIRDKSREMRQKFDQQRKEAERRGLRLSRPDLEKQR